MKAATITTTAITLFVAVLSHRLPAQDLYTAEGYWKESIKEQYVQIKEKFDRGDSLTVDETAYLKDYQTYLENYFNRLTDFQKQRYESLHDQWDNDLAAKNRNPPKEPVQEEFEWRTRDRFLNFLYGSYYGTALLVVVDSNGGSSSGIPLLTGGMALLGPVINPKKYEGITQSTIRAMNSGKLLGLGYGAALALTIGGTNEGTGDLALILSSISSIALGQTAFYLQKNRNIPDGQIEMMRHYGFLGPVVGISLVGAAQMDDANLVGLSLLGGGVTGLFIGKNVSKRYAYSRGDVDVVNSLAVISCGLGLTLVINALENSSEANALVLIPAAGAVAGTLFAQKAVRNLHFTRRQGSTINLATSGAALIGFGIMAMAESNSPTAIIAVPTVLSLAIHQAIFNSYKKANLLKQLPVQSRRGGKGTVSVKVMPENYLMNKQMPVQRVYNPSLPVSNPVVNLTWRWR